MTNETQVTTASDPKQPIPFGTRLKSAREALGLERKDAAAQLRLSEKVILMMEKDRYPADMPVTFIRGYIRAYGKLLQIPDYEIKKAIEPIKPRPDAHEGAPLKTLTPLPLPVTSGNYFMQFFTWVILLTMVGLVAMWWYTHNPAQVTNVGDTQPNTNENLSAPVPNPTEPTTAPTLTAPSPKAGLPSETEKKMTEPLPSPIISNVPNNNVPIAQPQTAQPLNPSTVAAPPAESTMSEDEAADDAAEQNTETSGDEAD